MPEHGTTGSLAASVWCTGSARSDAARYSPDRALRDEPTRLASRFVCVHGSRTVSRAFWVGTGHCGGKSPVKSTKLERRTQKLQLTTGMPWAQALKHVAALAPSAVLIPEAHPSQAVLESFFLKSFAWPQTDPHHPWGIRCVEPSRNRLVLVFEDQQLRADDYESLTRDLVRAVVPHVDEWGEVRGIPGARFTVARGGGS